MNIIYFSHSMPQGLFKVLAAQALAYIRFGFDVECRGVAWSSYSGKIRLGVCLQALSMFKRLSALCHKFTGVV